MEVARWFHLSFNVVEALIWLSAAAFVGRRVPRLSGRPRRVAVVAVVAFVAFAASDVWELRTGTWFRPAQLMVLNIACVAVLAACGVYYARRRKSATRSLGPIEERP